MKSLIFLIAISITNVALARQYIQCQAPNSWDHAVINLNHDKSTLFLTNRVDAPDVDRIKVIKELFFDRNSDSYAIYHTDEGNVVDTVKIPLEVIGKYSSKFNVIISHKNVDSSYEAQNEMICYSAIY